MLTFLRAVDHIVIVSFLTVLTLEFCFVLFWFDLNYILIVSGFCIIFLDVFTLFLFFCTYLVDCFHWICVCILSECFDRHEFDRHVLFYLCVCAGVGFFFGVCPGRPDNFVVGLWYCILIHENITSMLPSKHSIAFWWCLFQRTFC